MNLRSLPTVSTFALLAAQLSGCDATQAPRPLSARTSSELVAGSSLPVPVDEKGESVWGGDAVDLLAFDAMVGCLHLDSSEPNESNASWVQDNDLWVGGRDDYYGYLRQLATSANAAWKCDAVPVSSPFANNWHARRMTASCNRVPSSGAREAVEIPLASLRVKNGTTDSSVRSARLELQYAGFNLCVAQRLWEYAPGTSGASVQFLSENEARKLHQIIKERAQISVLQHLAIGLTLDRAPEVTNAQAQTINTAQSRIIEYGRNNPTVITSLGQDLLAALSLHSKVAYAYGELFHRSASAHSARGGDAADAAEERWGTASWTQRGLSLMYGGNPLVIIDGSEPWASAGLQLNRPGLPIDSAFEAKFPSEVEQPWVSTDRSDPRVQLLSQLAEHCQQSFVYTSDPATSAIELYQRVEGCVADQTPSPTDGCNWSQGDYSHCLLWKQYRIAPEHASTLANSWAEQFHVAADTSAQGAFANAVNLDGDFTIGEGFVGALNAKGNVSGHPKDIRQIAPLSGNMLPSHMPDVVFPSDAQKLGFSLGVGSGERVNAKRYLGAIPTLALARHILLSPTLPNSRTGGRPAQNFFSSKQEAVGLIDASIGIESFHLRPKMEVDDSGHVSVAGGGKTWRVTVYESTSDDAFWARFANSGGVLFGFDTPLAGNMALYPNLTINGLGLQYLSAPISCSMTSANLGGGRRKFTCDFDYPSNSYSRPLTFVAVNFGAGVPETRLLAERVKVFPIFPQFGVDLAYGGSLGTAAKKLSATDPTNPVVPEFDGFGFSSGWVPPTEPDLFGGAPGASAAKHYTEKARLAAEEAANAVGKAIESELQRQSEGAQISVAQTRSDLVTHQEQTALCGDGNADCNSAMTTVEYPAKINLTDADCTSPASNPLSDYFGPGCEAVNALTKTLLTPYKQKKLRIAKVVKDHISDPVVPNFEDFSGGRIQSILIQQWSAVNDLEVRADLVKKARDEAVAQMYSVAASQAVESELADTECGATRMAEAIATGLNFSFSEVPIPTIGASFDPGPMIAQAQKCENARIQLHDDAAQAAAAQAQSLLALSERITQLADATQQIALSAAALAEAQLATHQSQARSELDAQLEAQTKTTSFGFYRAYNNYELWRAQALVDNARLYALTARRAIEARYVVNMSDMTSPEPFVESPASWADEIFEYDLSMPSSVGLAVAGSAADGVAPNKILDYVENLERLVDGYAVQRPTAAAHEDTEIVTIPGPADTITITPPRGIPVTKPAGSALAWQFLCSPKGAWKTVGTGGIAKLCPVSIPIPGGDAVTVYGKPVRARVAFFLDPWGRYNGTIANEPYENRHNVRWTRLALNFVGTGIKDCNQAEDPQSCYSEGFVEFNLTHRGPAWVTDFDKQWHSMNVPTGKIESAKALVAEMWLDPLVHDFSDSLVDSVKREEFNERPMGGAYEIEMALPPEMVLERIERLQLLVGTSYWVSQQ